MLRSIAFFLSLIALVACAPGADPSRASAPPIPYAFDAGGIAVTGATGRIDFGRTRHSALRAMRKLEARSETGSTLCANSVEKVSWGEDVALYFRGGAFAGWSARQANGEESRGGQTC